MAHHGMMSLSSLVIVVFLCVASGFGKTVNVNVADTTPLNHYWKECVGSGHALLGTRRDWQDHLQNATRDLGFKRVRFHGVLDDDMSIILGKDTYNYFNVFTVYDHMLSLGVRPLVELSFMPRALQNCQAGHCQYVFGDPVGGYKAYQMPPNDFNDWYKLVNNFTASLVQRYGIEEVGNWYFEVWNELWGMPFPTEYMRLYNASVTAVKQVHPSLQVGGPATMQVRNITGFIDECHKRNLPFDFVSTHLYPTDPECITQSTKDDADCFANHLEGVYDIVSKTGKPTLITEYNDGLGDWGHPNHRDKAFGAAFVLHNIPRLTNLTLMSWWTFTDIFEEEGMNSLPFSNQFGLQNVHGVAKPAYRAFELLNGAGGYRAASDAQDVITVFPTTTDASDGTGLRLYISNYRRPDMGSIEDVTLTINIRGLKRIPTAAQLYNLDDDHLTAFATWQSLGEPRYPTKAQIQQLHDASQMTMQPLNVTDQDDIATVSVTVKAWSGAVVVF